MLNGLFNLFVDQSFSKCSCTSENMIPSMLQKAKSNYTLLSDVEKLKKVYHNTKFINIIIIYLIKVGSYQSYNTLNTLVF